MTDIMDRLKGLLFGGQTEDEEVEQMNWRAKVYAELAPGEMAMHDGTGSALIDVYGNEDTFYADLNNRRITIPSEYRNEHDVGYGDKVMVTIKGRSERVDIKSRGRVTVSEFLIPDQETNAVPEEIKVKTHDRTVEI